MSLRNKCSHASLDAPVTVGDRAYRPVHQTAASRTYWWMPVNINAGREEHGASIPAMVSSTIARAALLPPKISKGLRPAVSMRYMERLTPTICKATCPLDGACSNWRL